MVRFRLNETDWILIVSFNLLQKMFYSLVKDEVTCTDGTDAVVECDFINYPDIKNIKDVTTCKEVCLAAYNKQATPALCAAFTYIEGVSVHISISWRHVKTIIHYTYSITVHYSVLLCMIYKYTVYIQYIQYTVYVEQYITYGYSRDFFTLRPPWVYKNNISGSLE